MRKVLSQSLTCSDASTDGPSKLTLSPVTFDHDKYYVFSKIFRGCAHVIFSDRTFFSVLFYIDFNFIISFIFITVSMGNFIVLLFIYIM